MIRGDSEVIFKQFYITTYRLIQRIKDEDVLAASIESKEKIQLV